MCLNFVDEKMKACKVGWKVIRQRGNGFLYSQYASTKPLEIGKWLDEKDYRDEDGDGFDDYIETDWLTKYPRGWHIYNHKKAVQVLLLANEIVVKVEVKEPRCSGKQGHFYKTQVTVAKFIKITKVYDKEKA